MSTGTVVVSTVLSLDGFVAGPQHEMDWVFDHSFLPSGDIPETEDLIAATGAILAGRNSYDVGERSRRPETSSAFGGRWSGPEFVLTHRPPADDTRVTFLSASIEEAVATALAAAAGKNLLVLGADVSRQCLAAGLVDELLLFVVPMLLGEGVRLFGPGPQTLFESVAVRQIGQTACLRLGRPR